jgi:hypothetical protein
MPDGGLLSELKISVGITALRVISEKHVMFDRVAWLRLRLWSTKRFFPDV